MKFTRNERIGALMKILADRPNHTFTYSYFTEKFKAAKSTMSEDIVIARELAKKLSLGVIETIAGAAGGVIYRPLVSREDSRIFLEEICTRITETNRIIPGGFIYMTDVLYDPYVSSNIGKIFATQFTDIKADYIVTVETKGIPIALMTAQAINVPLIIIRRNSRVTEGPTVSINYVTGSTRKIQTMSLSRRALKENSKVIIIDDFMKAGGTAKGIIDMMKEFNAEVVGTGVFITIEDPGKKLVKDYVSLLTLKEIHEEEGRIVVEPNERFIRE